MLTLCMIARNSEDSIGRAIKSVRPHVDRVIVVLAGSSTDTTEALAKTLADEVHDFGPKDDPEAFFPDGTLADFAAARNHALQFVPEGSHWMYIDADDELIGGEHLADCVKLLDEGGGVVVLDYEYAHNDYGKPTLFHTRERLFNGRLRWQWQDRVHEWCKSEDPAPYKFAKAPVVKHHREPDEARTKRNLRLMELMLSEDPDNERAQFHYADGLYANQQYAEALDGYVRYHAKASAEPFQFHSATQAAECCLKLGDYNNAAQWAMVAIDMRPTLKDGYLLRARVAADMEDWNTCLFWLDEASDKQEATGEISPSVWMDNYKWNAWNAQYAALFHLRRYPEALAVATLALKEYPDSSHWWREHAVCDEADRIERSINAIGTLAEHFTKRGDTLNAWRLLQDQNLPMTIRQDERVLALRERIFGFVKHVWDASEYRRFYTSEVLGHEINGTSVDKYRLQPMVDSLKARKASRVLEVGSGAGGPAIWMLRQLPSVTEYVCLDINPDLVELGNKSAQFHGLSDRLRFECKDLTTFAADHPEYRGSMGAEQYDTSRPTAYFDAVLLPEIIEHMAPQDAHTLVTQSEEIGKSVMMTTPGMFVSDIPGINTDGYPRDHVKEWSLSDLEQLIFKVPRRRPVNIYKAYAPVRDPEWLRIMPDGEETVDLTYPYPGFANWYAEFDNVGRHRGPVCFYLGAGPGWSPLDLAEKGLGGAETMAMKMAEQYAAHGHPVCLYGDWTGVYNGVIYRHHSTFNPDKPYLGVDAWLFISSRAPFVFDDTVNADIRWLWEHDVDSGSAGITPERLANIDRILLLSEWHKQHWMEVYPFTPEEKIVITRNAIEPADFPNVVEAYANVQDALDRETVSDNDIALVSELGRHRHRFVWPSSPDRGLDLVLDWWPSIREQWPDAELHVFYGFDTIDAMSRIPGREWLPIFKNKIIQMANQPGVFLRGRVNQKQLHEEMAKAQFWLYPSTNAIGSTWNETYCIAALEAMAMGVTPIVADTGALPERLREFGLADGLVPWGSPKKAYLKALKAHDRMPNGMELARRWEIARELDFPSLYTEWDRLIIETSLKDNANGHHNFSVVSTTSGGKD